MVLELFALQPGAPLVEKRLFWEFRDCHIRGEWFVPHPDLLAHIAAFEIEPRRYEPENPWASGRYQDPWPFGRKFRRVA